MPARMEVVSCCWNEWLTGLFVGSLVGWLVEIINGLPVEMVGVKVGDASRYGKVEFNKKHVVTAGADNCKNYWTGQGLLPKK
jgi:hypothetical protein